MMEKNYVSAADSVSDIDEDTSMADQLNKNRMFDENEQSIWTDLVPGSDG